jgi:hypothetical protein
MSSTEPRPTDEAADNPESEESLEQKRLALAQARKLNEEKKEARLVEEWEAFMEEETRELEARRNGQLAELLGKPQPGEPPEALRQLVREDQRQAEKGLVSLANGMATVYKHVDELTREDMPAREAAKTMRTTWLKERRDGWLANTRSSSRP